MPDPITLKFFYFFEYTMLSHFLAFSRAVSCLWSSLSSYVLPSTNLSSYFCLLSLWFSVQLSFFRSLLMTLTCRLAAPMSSHKICVSDGGILCTYFHSFSEKWPEGLQGKRPLPSHSLLYPRNLVGCLPPSKCLNIWFERSTTKLVSLDRNRIDLGRKICSPWTFKPHFSDDAWCLQTNIK